MYVNKQYKVENISRIFDFNCLKYLEFQSGMGNLIGVYKIDWNRKKGGDSNQIVIVKEQVRFCDLNCNFYVWKGIECCRRINMIQ